MEATPTANNLPDETKAVQTSLLQLPLELRRMIYWRSILVARRPTPEQVHQRNFGAIWEDIPELLIYYTENNLAKWTHDGGPRHDLSEPKETDPLQSDIAKMLDHFACVTNVTKARIRLPPSLERNEQNDTLRWHAIGVIETMQGEGTLADEQSSTLADYKISDMDEKRFKRVTAQKARVKLDAITLDGLDKMSKFEWHAFTEVWPHFETLTEWEEGGVFKGEWHYMVETTSPDSSALVHTDAWMRRL